MIIFQFMSVILINVLVDLCLSHSMYDDRVDRRLDAYFKAVKEKGHKEEIDTMPQSLDEIASLLNKNRYDSNKMSSTMKLFKRHKRLAASSNEWSDSEKLALLQELYQAFLSNLNMDISTLMIPEHYNQAVLKSPGIFIGNEIDQEKQAIVDSHGYIPCEKHRWSNKFRACPVHWTTVKRENRYPHMRTFAQCTCSRCLTNVTDNGYSYAPNCMPVSTLMPVLIRAEPAWTFQMEWVTISCVCGSNDVKFIH